MTNRINNILITGCAGFIGSHLCESLLSDGYCVIGIDNFDPYYDKSIKESNLEIAWTFDNFKFLEIDILDVEALDEIDNVDLVIHIAAKAGVRPSIVNPSSYIQSNIQGTTNILNWMKEKDCTKMLFASSSSVYGNNKELPFVESDITESPISPYAVSKKACELMNHSYHANYGYGILNLRLFTVYGPRQRPDLAIRKFVDRCLNSDDIPVYGKGDTFRDYTFVLDVVSGFRNALRFLQANPNAFQTFNIASGSPVSILELVEKIGHATKKKPIVKHLSMQEGDVIGTYASVEKAQKILGFESKYNLDKGIGEYLKWIAAAKN